MSSSTTRSAASLFSRFCERYWGPQIDWLKWGFGISVELRDPVCLRLWIGPLRVGWKYGHPSMSELPRMCAGGDAADG